MDKVYQYGLCNFASCMATNPREGFFIERDVSIGGPFSQPWNWVDHRSTFSIFFDWFSLASKHSPLYRRGWVVQERLISPRTMHFTTFPSWECHETVLAESYPSELYAKRYKWLSLPEKNIANDEESPEDTWFRIVEQYSDCDLSHSEDKLIALCGVAKILSPLLGERYFAGLWDSILLEGLLWQVKRHITGGSYAAERPLKYVGA
jgi:hypothetical protein